MRCFCCDSGGNLRRSLIRQKRELDAVPRRWTLASAHSGMKTEEKSKRFHLPTEPQKPLQIQLTRYYFRLQNKQRLAYYGLWLAWR